MEKNIEDFKEQYYVVREGVSATNHKIRLKFQNSFPDKMCVFKVRTAVDVGNNKYESKCGNTVEGSHCFAPCNDVVLTTSTKLEVASVIIQTMNDVITTEDNNLRKDHYGNKFETKISIHFSCN